MKLLDKIASHFGSIYDAKMLCLNDPHTIIAFLLQSTEAKERFFTQIEGSLIFEKDKFLEFLTNRLLDSSYTRYANKIGLGTNADKYLMKDSKVVLNFAYKDCVLKGAQSKDEQKHKEIFFNEIIAYDEIDRLFEPKVLYNFALLDSASKREREREREREQV